MLVHTSFRKNLPHKTVSDSLYTARNDSRIQMRCGIPTNTGEVGDEKVNTFWCLESVMSGGMLSLKCCLNLREHLWCAHLQIPDMSAYFWWVTHFAEMKWWGFWLLIGYVFTIPTLALKTWTLYLKVFSISGALCSKISAVYCDRVRICWTSIQYNRVAFTLLLVHSLGDDCE